MTAVSKKKIVCMKCRGTNVQIPCWVHPNQNDEVVDLYSENWSGGRGVTYCEDCDEDTGVEEEPA